MGLAHSPRLITNGLVFYYDIGNQQKSWKGAPTTNLAKTSSGVIDWSIANLNQAVSRSTLITNEKYVISSSSLTGDAFRMYFNLSNLVDGQTYTLSYKYKILTGEYFRANDWNDQSITRNTVLLGNDVYYETATGTRSTYNSTYRFMDFSMSNNTQVEIYDLQLEQRSFATPYVESATSNVRSNTQALLDLTGSKTIDLINTTDSTFNSDSNALTLDGNNQYIYANGGNFWNAWSPNGVNGNSSMSIEVVFNSTDTSGLIISRPWNGGGQYNYRMGAGSIVLHIGSSSTSIGYGNVCTGDTVHMVYWMNPTQYGVYKNGQTHISATNHGLSGSGGSNGTNDFGTLFGSLYPYGEGWSGNTGYSIAGKYYQAKIYNRVLSAEEIRQNFNALRGRYGI